MAQPVKQTSTIFDPLDSGFNSAGSQPASLGGIVFDVPKPQPQPTVFSQPFVDPFAVPSSSARVEET